jgi:Asp-tRNA(Asn)/Glu-tRNA(Gln) amidotransferase B subunit
LEVEEQLNIRKNTKAPQKQQQTKWWREDKLALEVMREKETEADYNYIPEPNIPERDITDIVSEGFWIKLSRGSFFLSRSW